jgi:hypothetical protein
MAVGLEAEDAAWMGAEEEGKEEETLGGTTLAMKERMVGAGQREVRMRLPP